MENQSMDNRLPADLFDSLANDDIEGIIYHYALSSRYALQSIGRLHGFRSMYRHRSTSFQISEEKREERITASSSSSSSSSSEDPPRSENGDGSALGQASAELEGLLTVLAKHRTEGRAAVEAAALDHHGSVSASAGLTIFHLNSRNRVNGNSSRIPFFPSLLAPPHANFNANANANANANSHTHHHHHPAGAAKGQAPSQSFSEHDVEALLREKAKLISNARPRATFVVPPPSSRSTSGETTTTSSISSNNPHHHHQDEATSLFDGAVANSTPLGNHSGGGGAGTILHLACVLDAPLALAVLLTMGADASCRHTAFRRLILHESAASDSPKCLELLLQMGHVYYEELEAQGVIASSASIPFMKWHQDASSSRDGAGAGAGAGAGGARSRFRRAGMGFPGGSSSSQKSAARAASSSWFLPDGDDDHGGAATSKSKSKSEGFQNTDSDSGCPTFISSLKVCLELSQNVKNGKMSDIDAAKELLSKCSMSDANKYVIASTCRVHLDDINTTDGHGNTALHWAAFKNSIRCTSVLLSHQSNPNAIANTSGWTPLHDAAYSDSTETLSLLISAGSDVNAKANSGATPLCFAAQEDAPNATRILLEAGADPTLRCCDEEVHKHGSSGSGAGGGGGGGAIGDDTHGTNHTNSTQNLNRFSGYSPLHYCAHYNAHHAARMLLQYHNDILVPAKKSLLTIPDLNEKLPIHVAVARGSSDVLRELLHFGACVETGRNINRNRSCSAASYMSIQNDDQSFASFGSHDDGTNLANSVAMTGATSAVAVAVAGVRSQSFDVPMEEVGDEQEPASPEPYGATAAAAAAIVTPVSSPLLRSMIPTEPIDSPKPWNCISQRSIDECRMLIQEAELNWAPERHSIFHPRDRAAVVELLKVGKRFEQEGTGIFIELWPLVLSFCCRGWFEPSATGNGGSSQSSSRKRLGDNATGGAHDGKMPSITHLV